MTKLKDIPLDTPFSSSILENLHPSLKDRIVLLNGVLHWSVELKGNMELDSLVARLQRYGIHKYSSHKPEEFDKHYKMQIELSPIKSDNEVQAKAIELIHAAYKEGASDIHITNFGSYTLISFRSLGMVRYYTQLSGKIGSRVIQSIYQSLGQSGDATFTASKRQDARITDRDFLPPGVHSIRIHTEPIQSTHSADGKGSYLAMRLLFDATKAKGNLEERLASLGFTPDQQKTFRSLTQKTGLNIISGPTGHGKTTTLKQVMESMAEDMPQKNYMSIEDPPEYPLVGVKQILVSTQVSEEEKREEQYAAAIAGLMRSDLDTGMIGEIRYKSAAQASIEAALTGHGIWTTIHASNALAIVSRFREMGISLSSLCNQNVLSGLSYQRLIPLLCPDCKVLLTKKNYKTIPDDVYTRLERACNIASSNIHIQGEGCNKCSDRGLKGQTVVAEVIAVDHKLLQFLRDDDLFGAQKYWIKDCNGMTHVAHAINLIELGLIDPYLAEMRLGVTLDSEELLKKVLDA